MSKTSVSPVGSVALSSMRIERSERLIGFSAAALAAISFAILWVPNLHHASRGVTGATYLAVGVVLAAFLGLATFIGRRVLMALGALFVTVGPWGPERLFQLLYLALTLWLVARLLLRLRAAKVEAESSSTAAPPVRKELAPPVRKELAPPVRKELAPPVRKGLAQPGSPVVSTQAAHRPRPARRSAAKRRRSRASTKRAALAAHA